MANYRSVPRNTDTAKNLEEFLDGFGYEDFSYGFESVVASLEEIAEKVDDDAKDLEDRISDLEGQLEEANNTIISLSETNEDLTDQLNVAFEEANQ